MTNSAHPLPSSGGSYVRNADGTLTLDEVTENPSSGAIDEAAPAAPAIVDTPKPSKVKEA